MSNFTSQTVIKQDLYSTIQGILTNAGWRNIVSKSTDFDVWYSNGSNSDKNLFFQMRETDANNANALSSTNSTVFTVRLINKYTPSVAGVAGTFERTSEPWIQCNIAPGASVPPGTTLTLSYNVDKNRAIFAIETPFPLGLPSSLIYIGMPNNTLSLETNSSGVLFAGTSISGCGTFTGANNQLFISNNSYVPTTTAYPLTVSTNLPPKNRNVANNVFISDLPYGNTTEGVRGVLDDVYVSTFDSVLNGDILTDASGQKYRILVVKNNTSMFSSFPTYCLALPIE